MFDRIVHYALGGLCVLLAGVLAAFLVGAAFEGWSWWDTDSDFNRQLTNLTYVQAAGVDSAAHYPAQMRGVEVTENAPQCINDGRNVFNPSGSTDTRTAPGVEFSFEVGSAYNRHVINVEVPSDKVNYIHTGGSQTAIQFVYQKIIFAYDNNWDDLIDPNAGGMKGVVSRCLGNMSAGQTALIGLKRVIVYSNATSGNSSNTSKTSKTVKQSNG